MTRVFFCMSKQRTSRAALIARWLVSGPPLLFLLLLVAVPGVIMLFASVRYPGEFGGLAPLSAADPSVLQGLTTETYRFFFSDIIYAEIFLKSFCMAFATTLLCLILAYPLAMLIAHSPMNYRNIMIILVILPLTSNFLIGIYAWMILLGPQGALNQLLNYLLNFFGIAPLQLLYSPFAVLIAMVYVHLPFMVLPLYSNLEKHDPVLLDAAQDSGANAWQRFWRITFPLSQPGIFAGAALVFIPALGMFAVPELLGGTGDILIGNLIKEQFLATRDWPFGATLSILLTVTVLLIVWLAARLSASRGRYA
jgi:spermidine/putrescine transport system permease protein